MSNRSLTVTAQCQRSIKITALVSRARERQIKIDKNGLVSRALEKQCQHRQDHGVSEPRA